jgi:hypothetical protein
MYGYLELYLPTSIQCRIIEEEISFVIVKIEVYAILHKFEYRV